MAVAVSKNRENGAEGVAIEGKYQGKTYKLRRRKTPTGEFSPFLYVDFEWQRRRYNQSTGTSDVRAAHGVAKQKIEAAMRGHWQQLEVTKLKQACATIGEVLDAYRQGIVARAKIQPRTISSNISMLRTIIRATRGEHVKMEALPTSVLTRALLQEYKEARFPAAGMVGDQERAITSINSSMAQARAIFSRQAMELYRDRDLQLADLSGFMQVMRYKDQRDVSFQPISPSALAEMETSAWSLLQPDESRAVAIPESKRVDRRLVRARPDLFLAYLMARYLGMRDKEIFEARWDWIERWPDGWRMAIVKREYFRPKYTEGRVPICEELRELIEKHGDRSSAWILPGASRTARFNAVYRANFWLRRWLPHREKGMHELRKQAGSEVYTREQSISAAAEFLRNKEETCRKHYAKLLVPLRPLAMAARSQKSSS